MMNIKAKHKDGKIFDCNIEILLRPYRIIFTGIGYSNLEIQERDLFDALITLRNKLDKNDFVLLCNGSRPNVYPSGMSRSMGGGRKAFVTEIGQPVITMSGILDIFDYAEPDLVGTVKEQEEYHSKWMESLKELSD